MALGLPGSARGVKAAVLFLLAVMLLLDVESVRHESLTEDEPAHYRSGMNILRGDATRFDNSKMPITALNALPAWMAAALPPGRLHGFFARVETGRYVTIAFSLLVAACVFSWSRDLYGPAAGLLSLFLYVFDPNVIAHSRLVTTDLYATGMITIALYSLWLFLNRPGWANALLSAGSLGLAQLAKYTSLCLYPSLLLILLVREAPRLVQMARSGDLRGLRRAAATFLKFALLFAAVSLLIINIGFLCNRTFTRLAEYRPHSPLFLGLQAALSKEELRLPVPYPYLEGLDWVWLDDRRGVGHTYLLGHLRGGEGFKGYFLVASLFKVPLPLLGAIAAALVTCLARGNRQRFRDDELFLLVPVSFLTVYFNFVSHADWGIRLFLVVFPLLHVLCGILLQDWPLRGRRFAVPLGVLAAWLVVSVLSYHPHYIAYFNELVWDRKQAYRYLSDSNIDWGQGRFDLARWCKRHPEAQVEPHRPRAGRVVVGVSKLTGVENPKRFEWLRENFEPVDDVAYAYLVFDVPPAKLRELESSPAR
jgi:hypothetical protein